MKISISNHRVLKNIPSGSGIAKYGEGYYVISDDSPFLFFLNKEFEVVSQKLISAHENFNGERIIKADKADFETLELINENELVVFGSGGKSPQRDVFVRIHLKPEITIEKYDISDFYCQLRVLPALIGSELNIEATAYFDENLYLFNRKKNLIIKFNYAEFLGFLKGEIDFPALEIQEFSLPEINDVEAGFSGATTTFKDDPTIIFTASVEDTKNAYDDGEILGSFIGMIDISNNTISETFNFSEIPHTDEIYKVESVTIEEEISEGETKIVLITDDDKGSSTLIEATLSW